MKKQFSLFLVTFLVISTIYSQEKINFHGKVLGQKGFVFNITILNTNTRTGTVSGIDGDFSMYVSKSDTIAFSCIGYKAFTYVIPDSLAILDYRVLISMVEDTVMLKETVITPWPINRSALKRAFLDEKHKEKEVISSFAGFREIDGPQREPPTTLMNPVSFIDNIFSKKRIAKVKMEKIRRKLREAKSD